MFWQIIPSVPFQPFICCCVYSETCNLRLLLRNAIGHRSPRLILLITKSWRNKLNGQTLVNCSFEESAVASDEFGPLLALPKIRFLSLSSLQRKSVSRSDTEHKHSYLAGWTKGWDLTCQKSFLWAGLTMWKKKNNCWEGTSVQVCLSPHSKIFIKERIM